MASEPSARSVREVHETVLELRARLAHAESLLGALRSGNVDAVVVRTPRGDEVFTLEGSDHPYRTLVESMPEGAASLSADGVVLYANERLAEMLGVPLSDIIGEQFERFLLQDGVPVLERAVLAADSGPARVEVDLAGADGSAFPARVALAVPSAGSMTSVIVSDLSENRQHERDERTIEQVALAVGTAGEITPALEAVLRVVCSKLGWIGGEAWLDGDQRAQFRCVVRHGRAPRALAAQSESAARADIAAALGSLQPAWSDAPGAQGRRSVFRAVSIPAVLEGETLCVLRFLAPAGPKRDDEQAARLVFAAARQLASFIRQRRTEQELAFTAGILRRAEAISGLGGWEYDVPRDQTVWTEQVHRIFGLDPATSDPSDLPRILELFEPDSAAALDDAFRLAVEEGVPYDLTLRLRRPDGERAWVRTVGQPTLQDGRVSRITGFIADVTDVEAAKQVVLEMNSELERRVAARTAELHTVNGELESFSYSVSHDLRAPLRAIDGFSRALARRCSGSLGPDELDMIGRILAGVGNMSALIDAMLVLSRLSRQPLRSEDVDLSALALDVLAALRAAEPAREVDLVIQEHLLVRGDPALLRTVLENLLGNAWKFTSATDGARIELASTGQGASGRGFAVRDNGAGFDMAYADHLFRPFERLHGDEQFPGTGIGLVTVQRIIHRHGGTIRGEGSVGAGAAFYFEIGDVDAA